MEVTCLEVSNPPAKAVLAIHAGSVRRQAKLEVNAPFIIPHQGTESGPIWVSLFQQLATQVLPEDKQPEVYCSIPVSNSDGASKNVQLRIRRGDALIANSGPKPPPVDSIGVTRDYLEHHQLQQRIQSLIQDVLREQPDNPYKYMVEQLRKLQAQKSKTEQSSKEAAEAPAKAPTQPLAPRAPAEPKPEKTGRNLQSQTKAPGVQLASVAPTSSPPKSQSDAQAAARYSLHLMLRSKTCLAEAEYSLRAAERVKVTQMMHFKIMNAVKDKMCAEAEISNDSKALAKYSVRASLQRASLLCSSEYQRALTRWTAHLAFRGASKILGYKKKEDTIKEGRRVSIPTPIVFLDSQRESWGTWLR